MQKYAPSRAGRLTPTEWRVYYPDNIFRHEINEEPMSNSTPVRSWVSTSDGASRLKPQAPLALAPAEVGDEFVIHVHPSERFQTIIGFGASFTETASWLLQEQLEPEARAQLMNEWLDPHDGIGISFVRQPMGATDISRGFYSYSEGLDDDQTLSRFSLEPDRPHVLKTLKQAKAIRPELSFMASPWSPPAWMREGRSMRGTEGGALRPDAYAAYAEYFARFVEGYAEEGIEIGWVTVQNEPIWAPNYPGMIMSVEEQGTFVAKHLGPTFAQHGLTTGILLHDHSWDRYDMPQALLRDPEVAKYATGTAFHRYDGTAAAGSILHDEFPEHDIFFTEGSTDVTIPLSYIVEQVIINSMRHWARCIVLWNLLANKDNGPYMKPGGCAICRPVTNLVDGQAWRHNDDYYALGHIAKFVQPGAVRIGTPLNSFSTLPNVAFENPDGSFVLLVMNKGMTDHRLVVESGGLQFAAALPSGACATYVWHNDEPAIQREVPA